MKDGWRGGLGGGYGGLGGETNQTYLNSAKVQSQLQHPPLPRHSGGGKEGVERGNNGKEMLLEE